MKYIFTLAAVVSVLPIFSQPNCEAFKFEGDTLKYQACLAALGRSGHYQFSRRYQEALDRALDIDSTFAFAYRAKSTAYLKSGDFLNWKSLMDQAVKYDPVGQLDYRGWCRYQFFRDYKGAIDDIELLDSLVDYDIGYSINGDYHLNIARALCYKALDQKQMAIRIIEEQLKNTDSFAGPYDYLHLGVLKLETGRYKEAIEILKLQQNENDLAENRYYIALAYKAIGRQKDYIENLNMAHQKYKDGIKMFDPYVQQMDKIYLIDIERELGRK